ncbi:MAG: glycosyltransferase [Nitrospirota bacterium]
MTAAQHALRIGQVNAADINGGAYLVAWNLFQRYQKRGHTSWLAVGDKQTHDPNVFVIPNDRLCNFWSRAWSSFGERLSPFEPRVRGVGRLRRLLAWCGEPARQFRRSRGIEEFDYPGSRQLLAVFPDRPDIIHGHNLHGNYFDLRLLRELHRRVPVALTLHDAWLLSGHCAHSFDCDRWKEGCGRCPDLTIHPAVERDATAGNWRRKRDIYRETRVYVATPSRWLMQKVDQSILAPAIAGQRVISNGVDLSVFHPPADKAAARAALGLPSDAVILLFTAKGAKHNPWKDYPTLQAAVSRVACRVHGRPLVFLALGDTAPSERVGSAEMRFAPYQRDQAIVARYYQAADLYVHAARADSFPSTVLEALACGAPVVASAVGGIPEQIRPLADSRTDEATGLLTEPGSMEAMAAGIERLITDEGLRRRLGANAAEDARRRFDLDRQTDDYLAWYREIAEQWAANAHGRRN